MMTEIDNLCSGCENNCCRKFKLYWSADQIKELLNEYPFLKVTGVDVGLVGSKEKMYRVMECERLLDDGTCNGYPDNRPSFCENTGVESRPAMVCKLHDSVKVK